MSEIQKIKRKNLDVSKYDKTIEEALNYRIYAESWYLDLLTNGKWECLVYGDYEVVMPIPLQYKLGIKFVLQPVFCQQLGVFYKKEIPPNLFYEFEKRLHKYRVRAYHFNEENTERYEPEGQKRVNFILSTKQPYEVIFKNYSKHRRKDIRKSERLNVKIKNNSSNKENYLSLFLSNYQNIIKFTKSIELNQYFNELIERKVALLYDVYDMDNQLIAAQFFLVSKKRFICMGFARDKDIENHNASAFVIDFLIRELSGKGYIVDFEGSSNPTIASFMKGFNPTTREFTLYENFNLSFK